MNEVQPRKAVRDVRICNVQGLHARPVMRFVDLAARFASKIVVSKADKAVDGKSPMEMMLLEATCGTTLRICAEGTDSDDAVEALAKLINEKFGED